MLSFRPQAHQRRRQAHGEHVGAHAALLQRRADRGDVVLEHLGLQAVLEELDERLLLLHRQ